MKKIGLLIVMLLSMTTSLMGKCDFSKVKLQQTNQGTYYKWFLSGWERDTCKDYMFLIYDFQTKKTDTISDNKGLIEVGFNKPGEYKLYVKLWDKCNKCDTAMYRPIKIIAWKPTAKTSSIDKTCDSSWFEMSSMNLKDTCWKYYYYIYSGPQLDSMTERDFLTISDFDLYMYYSFDDSDLKLFKETRLLKYKFPKNGKYLIITQYYNSCLNQDTVFFIRKIIKCGTTNVNTFNRPEPKLIGMYDMMGRPVNVARENEITIYVYSDGSSRKLIKR